MTLDWDRPGVVRATLKVEELAALVAGARLAAAALAAQSTEPAEELARVLAGFDRSANHLRAPARPGVEGAATATSPPPRRPTDRPGARRT